MLLALIGAISSGRALRPSWTLQIQATIWFSQKPENHTPIHPSAPRKNVGEKAAACGTSTVRLADGGSAVRNLEQAQPFAVSVMNEDVIEDRGFRSLTVRGIV